MTEIYENIVVGVFIAGLIAAYIGNTIRLRKMGE